jgi:DNA-directed RNA polymerase subunit beta
MIREFRKNFGRIQKIIDVPNLIDIQMKSYEKFLQKDTPLDKRGNFGLQGAFKSIFPISDFSGKCSLETESQTHSSICSMSGRSTP